MLRELGDQFSRKGRSAFKLNLALQHEGKQGEIDLLMYNNKFPGELLVVEGKALLAVDEINEVETATKKMQRAQRQLQRVIEILRSSPSGKKQNLWKSVKWCLVRDIYGVVVAGDAEPNEKFDHSVYPGISLQTVKDRLRANHFASPRKFWAACKDRRWLDPLREYRESFRAIEVGDVTYELPVLKEPAGQAQRRRDEVARRAGQPEHARLRSGQKSSKRKRKRR